MYPSLLSLPSGLFEEFDALHRQMDRLLGARGASSIRAVQHGSFPAINIGTTPEAIEIYAFAPGLDTASLEVSIDRGLLTIAGRRVTAPSESSGKTAVYARERLQGEFRRVVSLPEDADPAKVQAHYRDGVLRVRVEKREASRPRRIEVQDATRTLQ